MTRLLVLTLATLSAGAADLTTARAQDMPRGVVAEELLTRSRVAAGGPRQGRVRLGGLGGRLLWHLSPGADAGPIVAALAERTAVGGFVTYAPQQQRLGVSVLHYGAHADLRLPLRLGVIAADRVTPIASLAAGAFRVSRAPDPDEARAAIASSLVCTTSEPGGPFCFRGARVTLASGSHAEVAARPPAGSTSTSFALTPALGVRVPLARGGLALRADLRDVVLFRAGAALHNPEIAAGISVRL